MSEVTQATQESEAVTVNRESPLHYVSAVGNSQHPQAGITIGERVHRVHLNLRGDPSDQEFCRGGRCIGSRAAIRALHL